MRTDIRLLTQEGLECEDLVGALKATYTRGDAVQRQRSYNELVSLRRSQGSLHSTMTNLRRVLSEGASYGYVPDNQTLQSVLNQLTRRDEFLHAMQSLGANPTAREQLNALRDIGARLETLAPVYGGSSKADTAGVLNEESSDEEAEAAHSAVKGKKFTPKRRGWNTAANNKGTVSRCKKCGFPLNDRHEEQGCPAEKAACKLCGEVGHFQAVCEGQKAARGKQGQTANSASGSASRAQTTNREKGCSCCQQSGF
jgi:rubrerythrin